MNGRIITNTNANRLNLPIVGKLKCGVKAISTSGKEYPQSVDYFVPFGRYANIFTNVYGERPNSVQIVFTDNNPESVCNQKYEYRTDKGELVAWGDGNIFMVWNGNQYIPLNTNDYPNLMQSIEKKYPSKQGWKVSLTLLFVLPLIRCVAGLWQLTTKGSASSVPNIINTFDTIIEQRGSISGVLCDLNVSFAHSQKPNKRSKYPVLQLVPNESEESVKRVKSAFNPIQIEC